MITSVLAARRRVVCFLLIMVMVALSVPLRSHAATFCETLLAESSFYRDPAMQAIRAEFELRAAGNIEDADLLQNISCVSQGVWFIGGTPAAARARAASVTQAAALAGKTPVLVLYNGALPGSLAWGSGLSNGDYQNWISAVADGIGSRPAWIILEPDAVTLTSTLRKSDQRTRFSQLKKAVSTLKRKATGARVYLDGGHSAWKPASVQASYLVDAGVSQADGFFTNAANFQTMANEISYGSAVSALLGGKHFVIDTSRNGLGPYGAEWCNPPGRALGSRPGVTTGNALVDAFLWIKPPGESDGICNGGPAPGVFWLDYALELIRNAGT